MTKCKYINMKIIVSLKLLYLLFCLVSCSVKNMQQSNGWYYTQSIQQNIFIKEPIVLVEDFYAIKLDSFRSRNDNETIYQITGSLNNGKVKYWENATKKAIGQEIIFVFKNKILSTQLVNNQIKNGQFCFTFSIEDLSEMSAIQIFNLLQMEMRKNK